MAMKHFKSYRLLNHTEHTNILFGQNAVLPNTIVGGTYLPLNKKG